MSEAEFLSAVKPEDVVTLYKTTDKEQYQIYLKELEKLKHEKDSETNRFKRPWDFEVVQGFFKQSEENTEVTNFNYLKEKFGLKLNSWNEFVKEIDNLNEKSESNISYKVIFFARHGQGWHNLIIEQYGQAEWDEKWSKLNTDGNIIWGPDPYLTELGIRQALNNHEGWKEQILTGAPYPSRFYCSPLTRAIQTLIYTWENIRNEDYHVHINDDIRETIGEHTCDLRSSKSEITKRLNDFKVAENFEFEEDFPENDYNFKKNYREQLFEQTLRSNNFLNYLFEKDFQNKTADRFISITSHSGTLRSFVLALNHRDFPVGTGGMLPVVIKATRRIDDL